jgi:hypothetical protein
MKLSPLLLLLSSLTLFAAPKDAPVTLLVDTLGAGGLAYFGDFR